MLLAYSIVITLLFVISLFFVFKFSKIIFKLEESIETSLDILDQSYKEVNEILKIPILFDSREIKRAIESIKKGRDSILKVAQIISINSDESEE
jgi:hypothetical protein